MDNDFISGLYVFAPHERAASFVKAKLSIKPEQMIEWLKNAKANEKGFVSIDILESKKGGWYAKLDTYKKSEQTASAPSEKIDFPSEEINPDDIPF